MKGDPPLGQHDPFGPLVAGVGLPGHIAVSRMRSTSLDAACLRCPAARRCRSPEAIVPGREQHEAVVDPHVGPAPFDQTGVQPVDERR